MFTVIRFVGPELSIDSLVLIGRHLELTYPEVGVLCPSNFPKEVGHIRHLSCPLAEHEEMRPHADAVCTFANRCGEVIRIARSNDIEIQLDIAVHVEDYVKPGVAIRGLLFENRVLQALVQMEASLVISISSPHWG